MKRNLNDIFFACSHALDCIERELAGVTTNHGKRVAFITLQLAKSFSMTEEEQAELTGCAVLHDCALTEFLKEELDKGGSLDKNALSMDQLGRHCIMGEKNIRMLPFKTDVQDAILYHHENADATGVFNKEENETPLKAQIIHLADSVDVEWHMDLMSEEKYKRMMLWVDENRNRMFSETCADAFKRAFDYELITKMQNSSIDQLLKESIPDTDNEYTDRDLYDVAKLFARIIDYKSSFTSMHSVGIAEKAKRMAEFYGYDNDKVAKMYFAGALHDIGKLVVSGSILEKPDKLTSEEYRHIQNHAYAGYEILHHIHGMEDITEWASFHHEKLDGSGYPFKKTGDELSEECRIMCCLDIYQALTEDRPYKKGFSHDKAMGILNSLVEKKQLDRRITEDIDKVFRRKRGDFQQ